MSIEKLFPEATSVLPIGLGINIKKDTKKTFEKMDENKKYIEPLSIGTGILGESTRALVTGAAYIAGGVEAAAITYCLTTYTIDRFSSVLSFMLDPCTK